MSSINFIESKHFFELLNRGGLGESEIGVSEVIIIDSSQFKGEHITISNIFFNEVVKVTDLDIRCGLQFVDCHFTKGIFFSNVTDFKYNPEKSEFGGGIGFLNCKGLSINFHKGCKIDRGVSLNDCSDIQQLIVKKSFISNGGLKINKSKISIKVDISNCNFPLRIEKSEIYTIRIVNLKGDIAIIKSKFNSWAKFWNVECQNSFTLNHNEFLDTFDISSSRIKGLFIHGDIFRRMAKLENRNADGQEIETHLNELYITEANLIEGFEFDGMSKDLSRLTLPMSPNFQGVLKIVGWNIDVTTISGINQNLKLIFRRINFKRLLVNDFTNFGVLSFDDCKAENQLFKTELDPNSSMMILNSSLNNTRFSEYDFNSFDFINITNSSLEGIEASNVIWFSESKIQINSENPNDERSFRRLREIYKQIKQSLRSKGNQIDSLTFQAREMEAYRNELNNSENYKLSDRIIMTVNQTNNYGLDWEKPFWYIILTSIIFFLISLPLFSENISYGLDESNFVSFDLFYQEILDNLPVFAQIFNPARSFTATFGENVSTSLYFLDLLHRIILGILIFQLIRAFRRLSSG